ncbi:hypothetical protein [Kaarinaea lacus]
MKKWIIIAVIFGGLYYYAVHTNDGKKQFNRLSNGFSQWTERNAASIGDNSGKTTIYKIQNPDGTWTYSNEKPADTSQVSEEKYRSDTNVLPSLSKDDSKD